MIECEMDGLLRGMTNERVMKRAPVVYFLPIHRSVIERSDGLLALIHSWWLKDKVINHLTPEGWYS